jgi:hypothetical protein
MPLEEIADYCLRHSGVEARLLIPDATNPALPPLKIRLSR